MVKKALIVLVGVFCLTGFAYAEQSEEDCKALYDLYGECHTKGAELKSLDKCKQLGEEMYNELVKNANNKVEEALTDVVSTICDDACREAVDGTEKSTYQQFKEDECK
jgi:hypothetical protein